MTHTSEVDILLEQAFASRGHDLIHAAALATQALALAQRSQNELQEARALNLLGLFQMVRGEFQHAIETTHRAIRLFEKHEDAAGLADAKYNLAGVYYKSDNFHLGLDYLLECLSAYRQEKNFANESRVLKSMGTIYEYFGDMESAKASHEGSIEAARKAGNRDLEANAYNPLSGIYLKEGEYERAQALAEASVEIKKQTGDTRGLAFSMYALAKVALRKKDFKVAGELLHQSLSLNRQMGDRLGEAMALNKLGQWHYQQKQFDEAKKSLDAALQLALTHNIQVIVAKAFYSQYLVAKAEGVEKEALRFLEKFHEARTSVVKTQTFNVIKSYQSVRKIELLEHEAAMQREKNEIIEKKNAELDSFFYRISHDLKGPIASLLGLNNLVAHEVKDPTSLQYFKMYQSQVGRINRIVLDLIDLTQMNRPMRPVLIDFHSLIDECIHSYTYMENFKSIRFVTEVGPSIEFYSEWGIVNTVMQNLIENAIKYARSIPDAFVRICVDREGEHVLLRVADNGQGIHADHQARIFDIFYRANANVKGSGLGLYILKRAVERLRGEISFESELEKGSTFKIKLPLNPPSDPASS